MLDFGSLFTLEHFAELADELSDPDRKARPAGGFSDLLKKHCQPALLVVMKDRIASGTIVPIDQYPNAKITFVNLWNSLCSGKPMKEWNTDYLLRLIAHDVSFNPAYLVSRPGAAIRGEVFAEMTREERLIDCYNQMVGAVNAGVIGDEWRGIECEDGQSGTRLRITIRGWKPSFSYFCMTARKHLPFHNPVPDRIDTVELDFPTGEIMAFDWLRIEEFTKVADVDSGGINASSGRALYTKTFAETLNIAHVTAGNCSPSVYKDADDNILLADSWDSRCEDIKDFGKFKKVGDICCDLWWATVVDRGTVMNLLTQNMTTEAAELAISEYEKEWGVARFKVKPGKYRLHYSGSQSFFNETFNKKKHGAKKSMNTYCFIEPVAST